MQPGCETGFNAGNLSGPPGPCGGATVSFAQGRNRFRGPGYFNTDFAMDASPAQTKVAGERPGVDVLTPPTAHPKMAVLGFTRAAARQSVCRRIKPVQWHFTQIDPSEELAQLHFFAMKKRQPDGDVNFRITVKEYAAAPAGQRLRFFAEADKLVNQKTAALLPSGWGDSVWEALDGCLRLIRRFPYEGEERT
ncbi:MAG: hypothetical protein ABSE79_21495 [Terriglobia bacterium]